MTAPTVEVVALFALYDRWVRDANSEAAKRRVRQRRTGAVDALKAQGVEVPDE